MCLLASLGAPALARADEDPAPVFAASGPIVQNRSHQLHNELYLGGALLPSDAFNKEGGAVFGIVHHFNDLFAWEILHAHAYLDWPSGLRTQLQDNFGYPSQRFAVLRYVVDTNFVVSPIYAKLSLLNHNLAYLQLFALVGAGAGIVYGGEPDPGSTDPGQGPHAAVLFDVGIGVRLWLSQRWSMRYDLREYVSIDTATSSVSLPLFMSLSFAVSLGGGKL